MLSRQDLSHITETTFLLPSFQKEKKGGEKKKSRKINIFILSEDEDFFLQVRRKRSPLLGKLHLPSGQFSYNQGKFFSVKFSPTGRIRDL